MPEETTEMTEEQVQFSYEAELKTAYENLIRYYMSFEEAPTEEQQEILAILDSDPSLDTLRMTAALAYAPEMERLSGIRGLNEAVTAGLSTNPQLSEALDSRVMQWHIDELAKQQEDSRQISADLKNAYQAFIAIQMKLDKAPEDPSQRYYDIIDLKGLTDEDVLRDYAASYYEAALQELPYSDLDVSFPTDLPETDKKILSWYEAEGYSYQMPDLQAEERKYSQIINEENSYQPEIPAEDNGDVILEYEDFLANQARAKEQQQNAENEAAAKREAERNRLFEARYRYIQEHFEEYAAAKDEIISEDEMIYDASRSLTSLRRFSDAEDKNVLEWYDAELLKARKAYIEDVSFPGTDLELALADDIAHISDKTAWNNYYDKYVKNPLDYKAMLSYGYECYIREHAGSELPQNSIYLSGLKGRRAYATGNLGLHNDEELISWLKSSEHYSRYNAEEWKNKTAAESDEAFLRFFENPADSPKTTEIDYGQQVADDFARAPENKFPYSRNYIENMTLPDVSAYNKVLNELRDDLDKTNSLFSRDSAEFKSMMKYMDGICSIKEGLTKDQLTTAFEHIKPKVTAYLEHAERDPKSAGNVRRNTRVEIMEALGFMADCFKLGITDPRDICLKMAEDQMLTGLYENSPAVGESERQQIRDSLTGLRSYQAVKELSVSKLYKIARDPEAARKTCTSIYENERKLDAKTNTAPSAKKNSPVLK